MKPITEPKKILNVTIRANLALEMTEPMKKLYDDFWEKERKFYEDDSISEEEYDAARVEFEDAIGNEIEKLCPYIYDFCIDDFDERA